jgi:hypothetical protein
MVECLCGHIIFLHPISYIWVHRNQTKEEGCKFQKSGAGKLIICGCKKAIPWKCPFCLTHHSQNRMCLNQKNKCNCEECEKICLPIRKN